jgi:hypothetical protein
MQHPRASRILDLLPAQYYFRQKQSDANSEVDTITTSTVAICKLALPRRMVQL